MFIYFLEGIYCDYDFIIYLTITKFTASWFCYYKLYTNIFLFDIFIQLIKDCKFKF